MGVSEKLHQIDGTTKMADSEKWVISGIAFTTPLKPIFTKREAEEDQYYSSSTTPTSAESIISRKLLCPPAPKKRKSASSKCAYGGVREFFNPPDLETIFMRRVT